MSDTPFEPVNVTPPPGGSPQYPPPLPPSSTGLSDTAAGALAYVTFIPAVIFLVVAPYNRSHFVRFHSFQSIAFTVVAFAAHIVLRFIPFFGLLLSGLLSLALFVVWLVLVVKAAQGEWFKLPVIGDFAMQQAKG